MKMRLNNIINNLSRSLGFSKDFVFRYKGAELPMSYVKGGRYTKILKYASLWDEEKSVDVFVNDYYISRIPVTDLLMYKVCGSKYKKIHWPEYKRILDIINSKTGLPFRLPTEIEWEYAVQYGIGGLFSRKVMEMRTFIYKLLNGDVEYVYRSSWCGKYLNGIYGNDNGYYYMEPNPVLCKNNKVFLKEECCIERNNVIYSPRVEDPYWCELRLALDANCQTNTIINGTE